MPKPKPTLDKMAVPDDFPSFDKFGYPTEATLRFISNLYDPHMAVMAVAEAWGSQYGRVWRPTFGVITLATGGWSGCEDVWRAFEESPARCLTKVLSLEGGMHIVAYTPSGKEKLRDMEQLITRWATTEEDDV